MSARRCAVPGTPAALLEDLGFAAGKRLPEMFKDVAADRETYPTLARIVETVEPSRWAEDPTRALRVVMLRAVGRLPEEAAWKCLQDCTWQNLGRLLYFGSEVYKSLRSYGDYIAAALEDAGGAWSKRDFGRPTHEVRQKLATILLAMEEEAIAAHNQLQLFVIDPVASDPADRTLTAIYRRYITRLAFEEPESLQLLELLPFIIHECIPPEYLMAYLLGVPYIKRDQIAAAQLAYEAAIRPLQGYSLVTVDKHLGVSMDVATQNALRRIFADRLPAVFGRMKDFLPVDREVLYAEGWSALTVAGREACNRILFAYVKDQNGMLAAQIAIGGAQWEELVTQLWVRHIKMELMNLIVEGAIPSSRDDTGWDTFLERAANRPSIQYDELLGIVRIYENLVSRREDDDEPEPREPMTAEAMADRLVESIMAILRRYEDSAAGQLDLSIVNGQVLDPSEEGEARGQLREMARRAFHVEDEGQEPGAT